MSNAKDPREAVANKHSDGQWTIDFVGPLTWGGIIEHARQIIAADEAWKDQTTPTLEELRGRYPDWDIDIIEGDEAEGYAPYWFTPDGTKDGGAEYLPTEKAALRWLADELERQG